MGTRFLQTRASVPEEPPGAGRGQEGVWRQVRERSGERGSALLKVPDEDRPCRRRGGGERRGMKAREKRSLRRNRANRRKKTRNLNITAEWELGVSRIIVVQKERKPLSN